VSILEALRQGLRAALDAAPRREGRLEVWGHSDRARASYQAVEFVDTGEVVVYLMGSEHDAAVTAHAAPDVQSLPDDVVWGRR
jgi:hypothetical protein